MANRHRIDGQMELPGADSIEKRTRRLWTDLGDELRTVCREVVQGSLDKQGAGIAADLGVAGSQFSDALWGKGKHLSVTWLPRIQREDREHRIARLVARFDGLEVRPTRIHSPRRAAHLLAKALLSQGEAGLVAAARTLGPDAQRLLDVCLGDDGEGER